MSPSQTSVFPVESRLGLPGPKRLLAIDGAGVRTALALPILEKIEATLRTKTGDPELRLCDYFELIGGTGVGAVLAAALARGMSVAETRDLFLKFVGEFFRSSGILQRFTSKYQGDMVEKALINAFGDEPLRSASLNSGLCIFTYRIDTDSPFAFHNLLSGDPDGSPPLRLIDCLHASVASPTYFEPVPITISRGETGIFTDADLAMSGGAAMPLFLTATADDGPFRWPTGSEALLLVAVGSGRTAFHESSGEARDRNILGWATSLPSMLLLDAVKQNELFLRGIAHCPLPMMTDEEIESIEGDLLPAGPALTYVRYQVELAAVAALGLEGLSTDPERLSAQDDMQPLPEWFRIGKAVAEKQVNASHFPTLHSPTAK
jgi:uncharacterized protein